MKRAFFFLLLGIVFLLAAIFFGGRLFSALPEKASFSGLKVDTIPSSQIFLDGENLGKAPFEDENLIPGEHVLRLLPETTASFSAWERKITLNSNLFTYVNYIFGPTEQESAGEVLTLERTAEDKGKIVVLSDPDGAGFSLNGEVQGITPKALSGFENGEHQLNFTAFGYHERNLTVKTWVGHKLLVNVKLAAIPEDPYLLASENVELKVKILETPTGWLRVRQEPSLSASEATKVSPGKEYLLLEEKGEWFKIQYGEEGEGWISARYAEKTEDEIQPKP